MMYPHRCSHCDDIHQLTQEERDVLDEDSFVCDSCFRNGPPDYIPESLQCRCEVSYGMKRSTMGPGYFQDAEPGVITDTSMCPIHRKP